MDFWGFFWDFFGLLRFLNIVEYFDIFFGYFLDFFKVSKVTTKRY